MRLPPTLGRSLLWLAASTPVLVAAPLAMRSPAEGDPGPVRYSRDIRPILSEQCYLCHGPDHTTREADLRLDTFEFATEDRGGYAAIVPGDAEDSELFYRLTTDDPEEAMPPASEHKPKLTAEQLDTFRRWIDEGAEYEQHWAFVPPHSSGDTSGAEAIDAFVSARLAAAGLELAPEAEPARLLRRLFLDLTGLPPTLEELDAFLVAYEPALAAGPHATDLVWRTWVDRIFEEEPYRTRMAERLTGPWLDHARYADTSGIHMDNGRQIWAWRDWVLEAYRDNMPFDQFLTEQLAGDLLPGATLDQQIASGFQRNHVTTDEGGAIDEEYLVEYAADRTATTGAVFLGLTMACARCHDHKFDPVTQEDYFKLFAFYNSIDEPGLYSQTGDSNRAYEPFIEAPYPEQVEQREQLAAELAEVREAQTSPSAEDLVALAEFQSALPAELGLTWAETSLGAATSDAGTTFEEQPGGSLLAVGEAPPTDVFHITLGTDATDLRLLQLDALGHPSLVGGAPGRSDNGNAVLTSIHAEAVSVADPSVRQPLDLTWAWASHAQTNDDYGILRAFDARHNTGWAIAGHTDGNERSALFTSAEPFGFEGGTEVVVSLGFESIWSAHAFGNVRIGLASLSEAGAARLPVAAGAWYQAGPFPLESAVGAYQTQLEIETDTALDPTADWTGPDGSAQRWTYRMDFADGVATKLAGGTNLHFVAKELYAPTARSLEVSLGSDDGFELFVNGTQVAAREVPRGVAPDQDRATIELTPGRNTLVFKVINTGGDAGFYFQALESAEALVGDLVAAVVDTSHHGPLRAAGSADSAPPASLDERILHSWRLARSPEYAAGLAKQAELLAATAQLESEIPRTMVMRERAMPRQAYILDRGEYDKADPNRPVEPGVPGFLAQYGGWEELVPGGQRATRLDLARWMTAPDNPLVPRVAVNRLWQLIFDRGLVSTSADFGYQGTWPSHPELLDHLAVEFVNSGWDRRALLTAMVTSKTYRQSSHGRPEAAELDPDGALLSSYPRRRLDAEGIRDTALFVSGLLVEELGGPSVKPYQPSGLWKEVAMLNSNTREFQQGDGSELWRRTLYTYWKRASPPPSLLTFDMPTRESCVIQRGRTNTPLQALVLWNDEQYVEAARVLAQNSWVESGGSAAPALIRMYRRCTSRLPDTEELGLLLDTLDELEARFAESPDDAAGILAVGVAPSLEERLMQPDVADLGIPTPTDATLAAWTLVASAILNLHATITQG
ncbi:MAG: PSD1 and planctomycete cytochrome C domain-containing protein [Planctomycetota bacterium]|nr:PSD1 and planctomycete cytochrome C domain-containing protein [Planctomycetota bacterium]